MPKFGEVQNASNFANVDCNKSLEDYFGENYEYSEHKNDPIFQAFNAKAKRLNQICKNLMIDIGEAQVMYGKYWRRLRYNEYEYVCEWLIGNKRMLFKIINPKMHDECMKDKAYMLWFERGEEC